MPLSEKEPTTKIDKWFDNVKDVVAIFGGTTAILVVLLWFFGRKYAAGFAAGLNIPESQIVFSLWEYGEVGYAYVIIAASLIYSMTAIIYANHVYPDTPSKLKASRLIIPVALVIMMLGLVLGGVHVPVVPSIMILIGAFLFAYQAVNLIKGTSLFTRVITLAPTMAVVYCALILTSEVARQFGIIEAQSYAATKAKKINITLSAPLLSNAPVISRMSGNGESVFDYDNVYLILFNSGHYFLSYQLNSECNPQQIYMLNESDVRGIEFLEPNHTGAQCVPNIPVAQPTPTPMP
jgi:hypothetical protein